MTQRFYIEGLYVSKQGLKKAQKGGRAAHPEVEPFAQAIWAGSAAEALQLASEALAGGQWIEGPRISEMSEEERMRQMGAPLLPGFESPARPARKKKA